MPAVGFETWYKKQCPTVFVVKNIAEGGKRVRIFNYPIKNGLARDLLEIPYVSEADIRHSLLKGELYIKIISKEIIVTDSNIDLIQFDSCHRQFLINAGITNGLDAGSSDGYIITELPYLWRNEVELIGPRNSSNRVFTVLPGDKFIDGNYLDNNFHIMIEHNGRGLIQNVDFIISESGGIGTGYDLIKLISFVPSVKSKLTASYVIINS